MPPSQKTGVAALEPTSALPQISVADKRTSSDTVATAARAAAHATVQARQAGKGVVRGSRRFGEAVWGPLAKISGVLWLEITGSFFGIFALFAAQAAWSHRADLRSNGLNHEAHMHLFVFLGMALLFGYFCISSFVRAYRR